MEEEREFDDIDKAMGLSYGMNLLNVIFAYYDAHPDEENPDARDIYLWYLEQLKERRDGN